MCRMFSRRIFRTASLPQAEKRTQFFFFFLGGVGVGFIGFIGFRALGFWGFFFFRLQSPQTRLRVLGFRVYLGLGAFRGLGVWGGLGFIWVCGFGVLGFGV